MKKKKAPSVQQLESVQPKLICLAGTSPQVITETLYVYSVLQNVQFSELHILTTARGKGTVEAALLGELGMLMKMKNEYSLTLEPSHVWVHAVKNSENSEMEDIRNSTENEIFADFLFHFIREHTSQNMPPVYCSLAGGRKTMSSFMMMALNVFGRAGDRLSHILVEHPQLESNNDFYYPTKNPHLVTGKRGTETYEIKDSSGNSIDAQKVKLELAELPFVRLRPILENGGYNFSTMSYHDLFNTAQLLIGEDSGLPEFFFDFDKKNAHKIPKAHIAGKDLKLARLEFILFAFIASQIKKGLKEVDFTHSTHKNKIKDDTAEEIKNWCISELKYDTKDPFITKLTTHSLTPATVRSLISKIKTKVGRIISPALLSSKYVPYNAKGKGLIFTISLPPGKIKFI
ncbi:MAG: CRISPR-associated ring nuclease Csm6 [Chloroherpetonaceae bacterium]|nr:CRISPR-associated ring nuclease Csm6 [Chloroherpetonaceae bacterium]